MAFGRGLSKVITKWKSEEADVVSFVTTALRDRGRELLRGIIARSGSSLTWFLLSERLEKVGVISIPDPLSLLSARGEYKNTSLLVIVNTEDGTIFPQGIGNAKA